VQRSWRWLVVAVATLAVLVLPWAVGSIPARVHAKAPAAVRAAILSSAATGYSGYAEAAGGLSLPVSDQFSSIANLLGGTTQLRVWFRSAQDWRVDELGLAGETDVHAGSKGTWTWNYEANRASFDPQPSDQQVRLPVASDLVPADLGRRLLSEAVPSELSTLPGVRIAGRSAVGVQLVPDQPTSTVARVAVWADSATGIPLRVQVFTRGAAQPALSTTFLDFAAGTPPAAQTAFAVPAEATVQINSGVDLPGLISRFAGVQAPPASLAGFTRNATLPGLGTVGVFGRGVTEFVVAPLPGRTAGSLRDQLRRTLGVSRTAAGLAVVSGPLTLLLSEPGGRGRSWLLVGTVTSATLSQAAAGLSTIGGS
jgi:hypothetical protein